MIYCVAIGNPTVSVVIPSYRSARHIRDCLHAIRNQKTCAPFETIVVDSSDDGTAGIVDSEFPWVRLAAFESRLSTGEARNRGVELAKGELILFTDTDCVPSPLWIEQLAKAAEDPAIGGVGGSMINATPWNPSGSAGFYLEFFRFVAHRGKPHTTEFLVGGNCGYRRRIVTSQKFGDESLGEDFLFSWQASTQRQEKLVLVPGATSRHSNKIGLRPMLAYQARIGAAAARYRSAISPRLAGAIRRVRPLVLLAPLAVLPWIAMSLAKRLAWKDLFLFALYSPWAFAGSAAWAWGFFWEL